MKYNTVEIHPTGPINDKKWNISFKTNDNSDRVNTKTKPQPAGYYHYPKTISNNNALNKLIHCMIDAHNKEINLLIKSKQKLIQLFKPQDI